MNMIQMIRSKDEASSAITLSEGEANGAKMLNSDHANQQELFSLSFKAFHGHDTQKPLFNKQRKTKIYCT